MNRRKFFGALLGTAAVGTVSGSKAVKASPDKFIRRFTLKTKFGDYFFYWTGWKQEISTVVIVGQWIAEPVDIPKQKGPYPQPYDREHPAFYATTTGTGGALIHMNCVMDLSYQQEFPLITDRSTVEDKWKAQDEALNRLIKMIEDYEHPEMNYGIKYVGNGHMTHREKLAPGSLVSAELDPNGLTMRALKKVTHE